jgi:alkylresorcinol/alkylpyrone synthase
MSRGVATIRQTSVAVPEHVLTQEAVKRSVRSLWRLSPERMDAVLSLFDGAGVVRRFSALPIEALHRPRDMAETMGIYRDNAVRLGKRVATECLEKAGVTPAEVDLIITVSCTGVMIPSLDAYLANDLGFRPDVRRLPITELGCFAGAAALSHARDFIAAYPDANVLIISVELPTLSFQRDDLSAANLVSTALFGDGAAAALLTGRDLPGARILDAQSHLFPRTLDALGFDLKNDGFHVVLAPELPGLVRAEIGRLVSDLLARAGVARESLTTFVLHPGGRRILDALADVLGLSAEDTRLSRDILRDYGNLSSATVLFVLHECLTKQPPPPGAHALLGAFGPGFSSELLVLRWS